MCLPPWKRQPNRYFIGSLAEIRRVPRGFGGFVLPGRLRAHWKNFCCPRPPRPQQVHPHAAELALAYPTPLPHAYPPAQPRNAPHVPSLPTPRREVDSPYAWFRLAIAMLLSTIGGVGIWSFVVALPAVQLAFHLDRGAASLPYTLSIIGFALGGVLIGLDRRPGRRRAARHRRRRRAWPWLHRRRPGAALRSPSRSPTAC